MGKQILFVCDDCGYEDEYDEDYADAEIFPNGLECRFCNDGRLKVI